jgi:hypothetical protein
MQAGSRRSRRWLAQESPVALVKTGTEGGSADKRSWPFTKQRQRLKQLFGVQLKLIK